MNSQLTSTDQAHLRRALELAEGGRGRVSPNPLVGAVVVRDGEVIGEGFHAELGGLHAERAALADCEARGEDPAGATMYVTLEPCAHEGRQPPCVEAILEAGIARVVIASDDPSEKASGRGPGILRDGGVEVAFAAGAEAAAARLLNQPFRKHARTGLPLVTPEAGDVARRPHRHRARRLALDLRRAEPRRSSTAGAPNPTRSRSASAPSSPTTPCSPLARRPPDAADRQPVRAARLRLARRACPRLAAARDPRPVPGARRHLPRRRSRPPRRPRGQPAPRSSSPAARRLPTASPPLSPTSAAAKSPASSSRAAARSPRLSSTPTSSTRAAPSSLPSFLGGRERSSRGWRGGRGGRGRPRPQRPPFPRDRTRVPGRPDSSTAHVGEDTPDHGPVQGVVRCSPG